MTESQGWQRRHAIHIVSELPEDPQDALMVLHLAIEVVEQFLLPQDRLAAAPVLTLVAASRSRSRSDTGNPSSSPS